MEELDPPLPMVVLEPMPCEVVVLAPEQPEGRTAPAPLAAGTFPAPLVAPLPEDAAPGAGMAGGLLGGLATWLKPIVEVLTSIESVAKGECIRRSYKQSQAYDCRDALAKVCRVPPCCRRLHCHLVEQ